MMMERTTGCEREWSCKVTICSRVMVKTDSFPYVKRDIFPCDDGERQFPIGQWIDHWICGSIQEGEGGEDNILSQRGLSVLMNSIAPAPDLPNNLTVLFQRRLVIPSWCTESRQLLTLRWIERTNSAHFYDDEAVMVIGVHYSSQHYGNVFTEIDFLNFALVPLWYIIGTRTYRLCGIDKLFCTWRRYDGTVRFVMENNSCRIFIKNLTVSIFWRIWQKWYLPWNSLKEQFFISNLSCKSPLCKTVFFSKYILDARNDISFNKISVVLLRHFVLF